jgi:hypothetical protein
VAENWSLEQEYDGRIERWCFYCGKYQKPNEPESHKDGCLHIKALLIQSTTKQSVLQTTIGM